MMDLQQMQQLSRRLRIVLALLSLGALGLVGWYRYQAQQMEERARQRAETERIVKAFRDAGVEARKAWEAQGKPAMPDEESAGQAASDQHEVSQAKLWQSLPKEQRDAMRQDAMNAGVPAPSQ